MIVLTLPITPGKHNSFVTLLGPLIADIFSRLTGSSLKIMLNVRHSFRFFENDIKKYLSQLECLGIKPLAIESDNSAGYREYVGVLVKDLFDRGFLQIKTIDIIHCDCGVVELPSSVYEILKRQERQKQIMENRCIKCGGELKHHRKNVLDMRLPQIISEPAIYPVMYVGHLKQAILASERPVIISRNYRDGMSVIVDQQEFILDTDFCWMAYLGYFGDNKLSIVSGSDTVNRAIMAIKLLEISQPRSEVTIIVHPLLQVLDGKIKLSEFTIDDYLKYCRTVKFARTFLSLGVQWNKQKVMIKASDFHLVEKSVYPKQVFSPIVANADIVIAPRNFCGIFNSPKVLELLKIMRGRQTELSINQLALKQALFE